MNKVNVIFSLFGVDATTTANTELPTLEGSHTNEPLGASVLSNYVKLQPTMESIIADPYLDDAIELVNKNPEILGKAIESEIEVMKKNPEFKSEWDFWDNLGREVNVTFGDLFRTFREQNLVDLADSNQSDLKNITIEVLTNLESMVVENLTEEQMAVMAKMFTTVMQHLNVNLSDLIEGLRKNDNCGISETKVLLDMDNKTTVTFDIKQDLKQLIGCFKTEVKRIPQEVLDQLIPQITMTKPLKIQNAIDTIKNETDNFV